MKTSAEDTVEDQWDSAAERTEDDAYDGLAPGQSDGKNG